MAINLTARFPAIRRGVSRAASLLLLFFLISIGNASAAVDGYSAVDVKLPLFLVIAGLMAAFFFFGIMGDSGLLISVACVILLMVGFLILGGHVLLPTGETAANYVYGNNFTLANGTTTDNWDYGDAPQFSPAALNDSDTVFLFHTEETITYEAWNDGNNDFIGFIIILMAVVLLYTLVDREND